MGKNLTRQPARRAVRVARRRLERGPAAVMRTSSLVRVLGLGREMGTGLPQPIRAIPPPMKMGMKIMMRGRMMVPKRSIWARGLRETLSRARGRGSPSLSAMKAWAHSWMEMLAMRTKKRTRPMRINSEEEGSMEMIGLSLADVIGCVVDEF